jgi:hypothetical protein
MSLTYQSVICNPAGIFQSFDGSLSGKRRSDKDPCPTEKLIIRRELWFSGACRLFGHFWNGCILADNTQPQSKARSLQ